MVICRWTSISRQIMLKWLLLTTRKLILLFHSELLTRKFFFYLLFRVNNSEMLLLLCNFIEISLWHECSPVNLLLIFRTLVPKNTPGRLLLLFFYSTFSGDNSALNEHMRIPGKTVQWWEEIYHGMLDLNPFMTEAVII